MGYLILSFKEGSPDFKPHDHEHGDDESIAHSYIGLFKPRFSVKEVRKKYRNWKVMLANKFKA